MLCMYPTSETRRVSCERLDPLPLSGRDQIIRSDPGPSDAGDVRERKIIRRIAKRDSTGGAERQPLKGRSQGAQESRTSRLFRGKELQEIETLFEQRHHLARRHRTWKERNRPFACSVDDRFAGAGADDESRPRVRGLPALPGVQDCARAHDCLGDLLRHPFYGIESSRSTKRHLNDPQTSGGERPRKGHSMSGIVDAQDGNHRLPVEQGFKRRLRVQRGACECERQLYQNPTDASIKRSPPVQR